MNLFEIKYMADDEGENVVVQTKSVVAKTMREAKQEAKKNQPDDAAWFEIEKTDAL